MTFKETEAQETRAELEALGGGSAAPSVGEGAGASDVSVGQAPSESLATRELPNPITGELIDVTDPIACAIAIAELRGLEDRIKEIKRVLGATIVAESKRLGTKTLRLPGAEVTLTESRSIVWDVEKLAELLDLGLAEERWNELVREVVEQKVNANVAKSIAGSDDAYRAVIEAARTDHVGDRYVAEVKRSRS